MKTIAYGVTDVGLKREKNEDNLLINDDLNLFVVADGMGGHAGGEFASQIAVSTIEDMVLNAPEDVSQTAPSKSVASPVVDRLRLAIKAAGDQIYEKARTHPELRGMGTTTVAMQIADGKVFVAYVGDSRVYLLRGKEVEQITEDHSLVNEQVKAGLISAADAKNHQLRNIITRSVGYQEDVEIDTIIRDTQVGDRYLLCSDGLSNLIDETEIAEILGGSALQDAAQDLVDLAIERGGDDNITLVVVEVIPG